MASIRTRAASVVVLVSLLTLTGGPLFTAALTHLACAAKRHECARVPVLTQCCCGDHGDVLVPFATPTNRNDNLAADTLSATPLAAFVPSPATSFVAHAVDTSPASNHPRDLPVLLSDLRL